MSLKYNPGFINERKPEDFFGASSPIPHERRNITRNWKQFRSVEEDQFNEKGDWWNCTNQSGENQFEAHANQLLKENLWPKAALEFWNGKNSMGVSYIVDGKFKISTRFNTKKSGTKIGTGNSFGRSQESIRKDGVVPESVWPTRPDMTQYEYYWDINNPKITALGLESLKWYDWLYDQFSDLTPKNLDKQLEHAPIQIAVATCPGWNTGKVPVCYEPPIHAILLEDVEDLNYALNILDHYPPYSKTLLPGYRIYAACKGVLYPKGHNIETNPPMLSPLYKDIVFGESGDQVIRLKVALRKLGWLKDISDNSSLYDERLADVVFRFQLGNIFRTPSTLSEVFKLRGKRVGPKTREAINQGIKYKNG